MRNLLLSCNCSHFILVIIILASFLFSIDKLYSQLDLEPIVEPEKETLIPPPCVPDCRNETRVDFDTLNESGPDTVFVKDQYVLTFSEDSLNCKRLIQISQMNIHQIKIDSVLQANNISIVNDVVNTVKLLCQSDDRLVLDEIKKYYVKTFLDRILVESQASEVNPIDNTIQKCLCDKEIYLYEGLDIESEGYVLATQTDDEFESNGGTISRNLVIDSQENTIDIPYVKFDTIGIDAPLNTNPNKIVAILDSGIDLYFFSDYIYAENQTDNCLEEDYWGWNFIDDSDNVQDVFGHGTLVAASFKYTLDVESSRPNGIDYDYKILPVKVLDDCGFGTLYSVICGLYYARAKGAHIVNASWGLYHHREQLEEAIIELAADDEIQIVASTGNDVNNVDVIDHFPSGYSSIYGSNNDFQTHVNVFAVGGLNQPYYMDERCSLDKWNETNYSSFTIVENAMGYSELMNTQPYSNIEMESTNCTCEGTSYAAPRFSAALVVEPNFNIYSIPYRVAQTNAYILYSYWTNKSCFSSSGQSYD